MELFHIRMGEAQHDGLVMGSSKMAGGGAVLCNSDGDWILGFTRDLGTISRIMLNTRHLKIGFNNINVEIDVEVLIY